MTLVLGAGSAHGTTESSLAQARTTAAREGSRERTFSEEKRAFRGARYIQPLTSLVMGSFTEEKNLGR